MDEKVTVEFESDLLEALARQARAHGHDVAQEVQEIVRKNVSYAAARDRESLVARSRALRSSLPPQKTDSLALLKEDRRR